MARAQRHIQRADPGPSDLATLRAFAAYLATHLTTCLQQQPLHLSAEQAHRLHPVVVDALYTALYAADAAPTSAIARAFVGWTELASTAIMAQDDGSRTVDRRP